MLKVFLTRMNTAQVIKVYISSSKIRGSNFHPTLTFLKKKCNLM